MAVNFQDNKSKIRSDLNKELFSSGRKIMEDKIQSPQGGSYIGWYGFSSFIDFIEENYDIKKKEL